MTVATRSLGDLSRSLLSPSYIESRKFGVGPDFSVYTGAMHPMERKELPEADAERPIIRMRGSSTVQDLQGDIMALSALEDMTKVSPDLLLWLNHSYDLPQDLMAKLYQLPTIQMQGGIADLWIMAEAVLSNPLAEKTYNYIVKDKVRLGCSVGCQVLEWDLLDSNDLCSPIIIKRVYVVEWSVVSIPANQRCWTENAIKGRFARSLVEGDGDTALKLAPAFKSLYDNVFASVVENLTNEGLAKDLRRVQPRGSALKRIAFDVGNDTFYLEAKGMKKSLTREETSDLLTQSTHVQIAPTTTLTTNDVEEFDLDSTKAVSGKTSLPLMDIGTEWTGSKAEKQIFDYARGDDGNIQVDKAKQCFLWYDPDNADKQSGYRFPIAYIVSGSPKIVPLGVRTCANILNGGMGGTTVSSEDQDGMRTKCGTLYERINSEFHPDPEWVVPWEKKDSEKSIEDDRVMIAEKLYAYGEDGSFLVIQKEIADSESDVAMNRQDLGEIPVNDDGTHEPMTGTHSHSHTDKQGGSHEHEHSHNNDANHSEHSHAEKHSHPQTQKANTENDSHDHKGSGMVGCGCCDACTGEDDCTCCDACTVRKAAGMSEERKTEKSVVVIAPTPEQVALLGVYNNIGKQLGFPEHSLTTKCDLVPSTSDATVVRTMLSALDDVSDALIVMAQRNDYYVDSLMQAMGVPDVNDTEMRDDSDGGGNGTLMSLLSNMRPVLTKDGREISGKNRSHLQNIHDEVLAMHPDACKGVTGDGTSHQDGSVTVEEAQAEARQMGQGDSYTNLASHMAETTKAIILRAFEGFDAKSLVEMSVQKAVDAAMVEARANLDVLHQEQVALMQQVGKLTNMPLGRPTSLQRSVTPLSPHALDNTVTYEELLEVASIGAPKQQTLQDALAQTSIVEVPITRGNSEIRTKYRRWPAGVGGAVGEGVRPPLTPAQKTMMHYLDWGTYNTGGTVDVPLIDDPAERL